MENHSKKAFKRLCIILIMFMYATVIVSPQYSEAFSDQVIIKGATGDDVVELQSRLQYIGFYDGKIDGVFDWGTYWALRNYQEEFGLTVDGYVGDKTKAMLERSTKYDKEFVHRMLREGREFTYYGGVSKDIQKGPIGSRDSKAPAQEEKPKGGQQRRPGEAQETPEAPAEPQPEQPGETPETPEEPTPGEEPTPTPEAEDPAPEAEEPAPTPDQPTPDAEEPVEEPPAEPTPEEEEPEQQDNEANVEKAINVPEGFTDNDIQLLAAAVMGEARGEPYEGQVAVAAVILSRVQSPEFPNTVSGVIYEPRAFTAVADGQINLEPNDSARRAALDAINGQDPSGGALYFYNPVTSTSPWVFGRPTIKQIGKHIFAK
ncbi:cell wall hydrolase [Bacillus shivajii]|uniref:cell wall hydrolase n=1 Tax=Bacillus shivajii TaxID=1983719 RepID=UPI001CFBF798|nr:cell wall hydrolase [Bacillus shivajii]UCZ54750.1 cell wall hydrolase [Bacillus shivajii]